MAAKHCAPKRMIRENSRLDDLLVIFIGRGEADCRSNNPGWEKRKRGVDQTACILWTGGPPSDKGECSNTPICSHSRNRSLRRFLPAKAARTVTRQISVVGGVNSATVA